MRSELPRDTAGWWQSLDSSPVLFSWTGPFSTSCCPGTEDEILPWARPSLPPQGGAWREIPVPQRWPAAAETLAGLGFRASGPGEPGGPGGPGEPGEGGYLAG